MANENMEMKFARIYDDRSADIQCAKTFQELMIDPQIQEILKRRQYLRPTPVQAKSIPLLLLGTDMIVQAKAGTGKTLIFSVLTAHLLFGSPKKVAPQVMIVAPTREIAKQIYDTVIHFIPKDFFAHLFVGGFDEYEDIKRLKRGCQVAVGTCGRLADLIKKGIFKTEHIGLMVLDEADKLMEDDFIKEINYIFSSLPSVTKQVCVFSATYPRRLESVLKDYMNSPSLIRLDEKEESLIGIKEYAVKCVDFQKGDALVEICSKLVFNQCIVFCNSQALCERVKGFIVSNGIEAVLMSGNLPQEERFAVIDKLKKGQIKVLISTDVTARGIDAPKVDLVINASVANDADTHMHRSGRAGRFGGKGAVIHLLHDMGELDLVRKHILQKDLDVRLLDLYSFYPFDLTENQEFHQTRERLVPRLEPPSIQVSESQGYNADPVPRNYPKISTNEEKPVVGNTVPTRSRVRKLFYLKRDMINIRDEHSEDEWLHYSHSKFVFNDEDLEEILKETASDESYVYEESEEHKKLAQEFLEFQRLKALEPQPEPTVPVCPPEPFMTSDSEATNWSAPTIPSSPPKDPLDLNNSTPEWSPTAAKEGIAVFPGQEWPKNLKEYDRARMFALLNEAKAKDLTVNPFLDHPLPPELEQEVLWCRLPRNRERKCRYYDAYKNPNSYIYWFLNAIQKVDVLPDGRRREKDLTEVGQGENRDKDGEDEEFGQGDNAEQNSGTVKTSETILKAASEQIQDEKTEREPASEATQRCDADKSKKNGIGVIRIPKSGQITESGDGNTSIQKNEPSNSSQFHPGSSGFNETAASNVSMNTEELVKEKPANLNETGLVMDKDGIRSNKEELEKEKMRKLRDEQRRQEKLERKKVLEERKNKAKVKEVYVNSGNPRVVEKRFDPVPASGILDHGMPFDISEANFKWKNYEDFSAKCKSLKERMTSFYSQHPDAPQPTGKMLKRMDKGEFEENIEALGALVQSVLDGDYSHRLGRPKSNEVKKLEYALGISDEPEVPVAPEKPQLDEGGDRKHEEPITEAAPERLECIEHSSEELGYESYDATDDENLRYLEVYKVFMSDLMSKLEL
ncbi:unnamed protein product [Bursaphelenchus xylophilus]|uniref:RNA helicase n=1 Tax=Bursaphelenchus xylophilus TaxID=6326 RepID=A0A1I7S295_BURXY|nr:unnamed protein product [Bursaphelenchus xylophilus]CAG9114778.1 unnamed protein product [Bursaphelenchus xylophilus]